MRPRPLSLIAPRLLLCLAALAGCDDDDDVKDSGLDDGCGADSCGDDDAGDGGNDASADGGNDASADGGSDASADGGDDDSGGDDGVDPVIVAEVSGTITVQLTQLDSMGEILPLAWEDSPFVNTDGSILWPYGKIFVGGYTEPSPGLKTYVGTSVLMSPEPVNPYTLPIVMAEEGEILVYASLDEFGDDIVGSQDPIGVWPLRIPITEGLSVTSVDIVIQVLVAGGGGGDGGGGGETITISGEALVTDGYSAAEARVMLVNLDGTGPIASTRAALTSVGTGTSDVSGPYAMEVPAYLGQRNLVGAIDSNANSMIDPADTWGATTLTPDVDGNPILVGNTDLVDYPVQIPLGDDPGISVIPFVQLSGTITGWLDPAVAMTAGDVYVTALKYRQNTDFNLAASSADFDTKKWSWGPDNLAVETSKDYTLLVPANSVVYLWGYGDPDGDFMVNNTGSPVSSVGPDGRIAVGNTNISGLDMTLALLDP